jgi:hypothetical protein
MLPGGCTQDLISRFISNWTVADHRNGSIVNGQGSVAVDYCLSAGLNPSQEMCSVGFSSYIMWLVVAINALKCGFVIFTSWKSDKFDAIVTLGDAIASFLQEPDHYTEKMCLANKRTFMGKTAWRPQFALWYNTKSRWVDSVTKRRFWLTIGL